MQEFRWESTVSAPVAEVFGWHERRGAINRLLPPWEPVEVVQEAPALTPGSRAVLRLAVPGKVGPRWVAEHVEYAPPHGFRDLQVSGPFKNWQHWHRFAETPDDGTVMTDEVSYELPLGSLGNIATGTVKSRLRRMFAYRHRQLAADLAVHAAAAERGVRPMRIAVSGAGGLIGTQLCAFLSTGGHEVIRLVRRAPRTPDELVWDPARGVIDADALRGVDAVVHLAGSPIATRWTESNKTALRDSRTSGTGLLARTLADLKGDGGPRVLVSGSAIGYYGPDRGSEVLTEDSASGDGFLADVVRDWESATAPAEQAGVRVVRMRTGLVQSPRGGSLRVQVPLFEVGAGGRLGTGKQWLSWISIDDIVGLLHHALTSEDVAGPVNGTAPEPVTNDEYTRVLGRVLRRPTKLPVPGFGPRLVFGGEAAREFALAGQRVLPTVAKATGYQFRHPDLESALRHVLGRVE